MESSAAAPFLGLWFNEHGSTMNVTSDTDGVLAGVYCSTIGQAVQAKDFYILTGRYDTNPPLGQGTTVGWVVNWLNNNTNVHSTTTWSGQHFTEPAPQIFTQWLLTRSTPPGNQSWNSTQIGGDVFNRTRPVGVPGCVL